MFLIFFLPVLLFGQPKGGVIIQGAASFAQPAQNVLEISAADQTVLHWETFSLAEGERARFLLPHPEAAVLNRVTGEEVSVIHGILEGNGRVFLLNPNGLLIGKSGVIDAFAFSATACKIENWGRVAARGGPVELRAAEIQQRGSITAQNKIHLFSEGEVFVDGYMDLADGMISLEAGRIQIAGSFALNSAADLFMTAQEDIVIASILGNLQSGNVKLNAGRDIRIQSSPFSSAQVFAQGGRIELSARHLFIASEGTPAEMIALNGEISLKLKGSLELTGGVGNAADAFARISGELIRIDAEGNLVLQGGGGPRCVSEICAQDALLAQIGGNLEILGGSCHDRSYACLNSGRSVSLEVGGSVKLLSGCSSSVQISSRCGPLSLSCESIDLRGPARIKAKDDIQLASRENIILDKGEFSSKEGRISLEAQEILIEHTTLSGRDAFLIKGNAHLSDSILNFLPNLSRE